MKRGDVFLARAPHASGSPPKNRPVLVVQSDYYNKRIQNLLVATITGNLSRRDDAAHLLIEVATPEGQQSGLHGDSLVSCLNLAVISPRDIGKKIGALSDQTMQQIDECLKAAMGIA